MRGVKIAGIVLIALGIVALVYNQFSYTKETHEADLGPLELEVKEKRTVDLPPWVGIAVIAAGVVMLVIPRKQ